MILLTKKAASIYVIIGFFLFLMTWASTGRWEPAWMNTVMTLGFFLAPILMVGGLAIFAWPIFKKQ